MTKALFLDRDGVINVNHGYVYKKSEFDFIEGAFELVKRANEQGYTTIVVTNQSGIGRGMYTESDFESLSVWMIAEFKQRNAHIDDVLFCPHHPDAKLEKYKKVCTCRKPEAGMLFDAALKHAVSLSESIMVGDKLSDVQVAINAGLREVVWFNEDFLSSEKLDNARELLSSIDRKGTIITTSHTLHSVLSSNFI
ncbi:D-glycero-alpha-D-manno-heptose-1,7-bisphosphate 7-phosphatase [Glaciecola sp. MF2-115]|uniref:D-glycero-alpha-D-manno-heptose-1,7-bisphosphate 7-phosphatase n=1 Tax=Glaciecola sp. MF2-115 TaxID=3384827 RepID=UPI0039A10AF7